MTFNVGFSDSMVGYSLNIKDFSHQIPKVKLVKEKVVPVDPSDSNQATKDLEVVSLVVSGDKQAFRLLFDKYYPRVLSAARRLVGNDSDASDLTQEVFLKAFKNISSFKGDSSFYTWVYRILVNACIDSKRKSSVKNEISSSEEYILDSAVTDPVSAPFHSQFWSAEDKVYASELRSLIGKALEQLSPAHRDIIIKREVDGLSYEEISTLLGCSLGTVMSRLFHARKNLMAILESDMKTPSLRANLNKDNKLMSVSR